LPILHAQPHVELTGSIESFVPEATVSQTLDVMRAGLLHAASRVQSREFSVNITFNEGMVLVVKADGAAHSVDQPEADFTLRDLHECADDRGGLLQVDMPDDGTIQIVWTAPLVDGADRSA
jgi:hypothetical protein